MRQHPPGPPTGRYGHAESIQELDTVVLERDLPEHGLRTGDVGAVVHRYADGLAFEVEFVTGGGESVAVATLSSEELRHISAREILHVRGLAPAYRDWR